MLTMRGVVSAGLAVILSIGATASATDPNASGERRGEIGFLGGGVLPDDDLTREGDWELGGFSVGLAGGYSFTSHWQWFIDGLYSEFDSAPLVLPNNDQNPCCGTYLFPVEETLKSYSFRTGVKYRFGKSRRWNVAFGGGWMKVHRNDQLLDNPGRAVILPNAVLVDADIDSSFGSVGIGQRFALGGRSAISWEVRVDRNFDEFLAPHVPTDADQGKFFLEPQSPYEASVTQVYLLAGFSWGLGKAGAAKAEVASTPVATEIKDADGDGVPDSKDQCPGTPPGTSVDLDGCPADADGDHVPDSKDQCPGTAPGTQVGLDGCPADADGDRVPDSQDQCPGTAPGTSVGLDGCPADADGDRIPDSKDQCPGTPAGTPVGFDGCPSTPPPVAAETPLVLEGVGFELNSATLTATSLPILDRVADSLRGWPAVRVEVGGHTCSLGSDEYDNRLSLQRAEAVRDYLISKGVPPTQLEVKGYGKSRPIASNATEEERKKNRRVELSRIN